jgi:filamentous hemagglutinin
MNKNLYRLVFNAAHGMLVAVQESAVNRGKSHHAGSGTPNARTIATRFALPAVTLAVWIAMGVPVAATAQIVADPNAGANRPAVGQTANGLPQVDITRPSAGGVSLNHYSQFDVNKPGAILNNSPTAVLTQQAGYINGNPNLLPGQSARIIVNQVTGTLPSQLRGYVEVAGARSEVVIANPNGLVVNGLGFINTSRATLTTGMPVFGGSGSLDAFRVTGGHITVQGAGMNAANVDQVDLVARAVQANSALYANRLNVIAGANRVDHHTLAATPIAGTGPMPALGIDVAQLGGMYANKILLASTEHGVGVSLRGIAAAQSGDLTLTAQGRLLLVGQTNASGNLAAYARDGIENSGITYAAQDVSVDTDGELTNTGMLAAQQRLDAKGGSVASTGTLAAGVNQDGTVAAPADLTVTATSGALTATGRNQASGSAALQGASVNLAGSQTAAGGNLKLAAMAGDLDLTGATTTAGAGLAASASGAVLNDHGQMLSEGATSVTAGRVSNAGGQIASQGAVAIQTAGSLDNRQGAIQAGGALDLDITSSLNNASGTLYGGNGLTLAQSNAVLNNDGGKILGKTDVTLNTASISNAGGAILANRDIAVSGAASGSGTMQAGRNLSLDVAGDYTNDAANTLRADGDMRVSATGTLTNTGTLAAAGGLTVKGTDIVNAAGAGMNSAATRVDASNSLTNAGRIEGDVVETSSATTTNTGTIIGNSVTVQGTDIVNDGESALMAAVKQLNVYATNSVQNLDGANLYSAGDLQIARDGTRDPDTGLLANQVKSLINSSATIQAEGDIDIAANEVVNKRTSIVTEAGTPTTVTKTLVLWKAGFNEGRTSYGSTRFPQWRWSSGKAAISADMLNALRQPITVEVPKTDVKSVDAAKKTLSFIKPPVDEYMAYTGCAGIENCASPMSPADRTIVTNPTQHYEAIEDTGTTYRITFWPDFDPDKHIRPDQVRIRYDLGPDRHDYNEVSRTVTTTTSTDRLVSATPAALMQAGGNLRINSTGGSILNQSSTMTAGGDLVRIAPGGAVKDEGTVLQQHVSATETSTFYWHQKSGRKNDTQAVPYPTTPQAPTSVEALPAIATGNQSVQTDARTIDVTTVNRLGDAVTGNGGSDDQGNAPQTLGTAGGGIPNLKLPTNGLYHYQPAPEATYLIATDPRFTQYGKFLSSDYMLGQLGLDPMATQKRLGDGFYEEKLMRDQVTQLTGRTYLAGFTDNLSEYQALMDNGVAYAKSLQLTPGIGLTADQMAQLTTDMVWLVSQDVTLPNGTRQSVLVPKVYLAQSSAVDLQSTGALVAGGSVYQHATGDVNNSGRIVGDLTTQVIGNNIINRGQIGSVGTTLVAAQQDVRNLGGRIAGTDTLVTAGRDVINDSQTISNRVTVGGHSASATAVGSVAAISGTNNVGVLAGRDIAMAGGTVNAGNDALLAAGRDLNLGTVATATTQDSSARGGQSYYHDQTTAGVGSSVQAGNNMTAVAGRDATLTGSALAAGGDAALLAGRDTTIQASLDTRTHSEGSLGGKLSAYTQSSYDETARGSIVQAGNNATLGAGQSATVNQILQANGITPAAAQGDGKGNLAVLGSAVATDKGAANLVATGSVTVGTVTEQHQSQGWAESKRSGLLSKEKTTTRSSEQRTVAVGSVVSADSVNGQAGHDLTVSGSTVAATHDVSLAAGNNLTIGSAQSTSDSHFFQETTKTGFGATGAGISFGKRNQKDTVNDSEVTQTASLVGSTQGSVHLNAGNKLQVTGSELVAAKDIIGVGADVTIDASRNTRHHDETHEVKQTGVTLGVSGGAVGAAINAGNKVNSATKSQDGRASALWGVAAGRDLYDAQQLATAKDATLTSGVALTVSIGTSQSKQTLTQDSTTHTGSRVTAGGTALFQATGKDANGNATAGNLNIVGSDINATNVHLLARNDVNIVAATDTDNSRSTNKSSSGSLGVSYGLGQGAAGLAVSVSASGARGNSDSTSTTQVNSHIKGSQSVTIGSGNDTTIQGATVSGGKVIADVGGNLNIASQQDTGQTRAKQESVGGGITVSTSGASGSVSATQGKGSGNYANVSEQSGIFAGQDGFDINVKGNTDLKGAVIASDATGDKNNLTTGTLTYGDIRNHSDYSVNSMGLSAGGAISSPPGQSNSGQTSGKNTGGVSPMIPQNESGSQDGTARSAVADGAIHITNDADQKQDVAGLSRDTSNTNTQVGNNPDLQNILNKQADMMAAAQAAGEAVAKTVGDVAGAQQRAALAKAKAASDAGNHELAQQYLADAKSWDEGGANRAALHAAGGALIAGLGGGNALAGAVGAGVVSLAGKKLDELSQSIAGSVGSGNSDLNEAIGNLVSNVAAGGIGLAVGGGSGAAAGANVDRFNRQLHSDEKAKIRDQANGDKAKEERLTRAACYAVKCWAEHPVGSDAYNKNYVSLVEVSQLGPELEWVNRQQEAGLFDYTPGQKITDMAKGDPLGVAKDVGKIVLGGVTAKTGAGLCTSGLGCATGGWMVAFGLSDSAEGADGLYNRYNGISSPGINPLRYGVTQIDQTWGNTAYDGLNLATSILALRVKVPLKVGNADGLNRPTTMFDVTVPRINNGTMIPFINKTAPHGTTQGILLFGVGSKGATVINDIRQTGEQK